MVAKPHLLDFESHFGGPVVEPSLRSARWQTLAIFALSGAAGLIYEVVWARQLVLVFGNTTQALSAILTGFFGGMAIGSGVGGRLGDHFSRPLRLYAILELALVVVVLSTPISFGLLQEVYRGAYPFLEGRPTLLGLVRFGLSLLALGPATVLMGVTLPALTKHLTRDISRLSVAFGSLYAANTAGAIIGTIAAGFLFIEMLGLKGTLVVGAACSLLAGIVALTIDRRNPKPAALTDSHSNEDIRPVQAGVEGSHPPPKFRLAIMVAFASGLTSLAYQVLWTRLLSNGTGSSTYVFTIILAIFLFGLAAGAQVFSLMSRRIDSIVSFLAQGQLGIAILVIVPTLLAIRVNDTNVLPLAASFQTLFSDFVGPVALVVSPATFFMGLTFPAVSALIADSRNNISTNTGLLLSANTFGAIVGTFVVPFFLIPVVGSIKAIGIIALINVGVALALMTQAENRLSRERRLVQILGGTLAIFIVGGLVNPGVFVNQNELRVARHGGTIFEAREDRIATVEAGHLLSKQLWVGGTSMTGLTVDAKLMPILPLMLRPASQNVLIVAFGMGSSHRTALRAGLRSDVVELVPSVPPMFHWFFPDAEEVLRNRNGRIIVSDGRNYLELTERVYDMIVTDPPPPIESAGVSVISSREYYAAAKAHLTPAGVMMQWVPYRQTVDEFKAHVRTYRDVFEHVIISLGPGANGFFMLGSDMPLQFDPASTRRILERPHVLDDLASSWDSPERSLEGWVDRIPALVWIASEDVEEFAGPGPLVTDDRPLPEYFLLRHMLDPKARRMSPRVVAEVADRFRTR